jgi:hypothetical protein
MERPLAGWWVCLEIDDFLGKELYLHSNVLIADDRPLKRSRSSEVALVIEG